MPSLSRRRFLAAGAATAGVVVIGGGPASASTPRAKSAALPFGDLRDLKHVVILMQENRSFDHYFGCLAGTRGFGDRSTITLPGGYSVFEQPLSAPGHPVSGTQFPWRLSDAPVSTYPADNQPPDQGTGAQGAISSPHGWDDQHAAWQGGLMNGWVNAKVRLSSLGYLTRDDIPFQYALADAYTIGDAYHCSVLSSTGPNRTMLWSGTIDAQQKYSTYTAYKGGDELHKNLPWQTYAETLQNAGVSWRVYQCADHFNDNGLEYFRNFAVYDPNQGGVATPGNPLYDRGIAPVYEASDQDSDNASNLANAIVNDITAGALPQVSWVVSNQLFSEHPDGAPDNGAYLVNAILEALNQDPDVLNSTLLVINYDENDGGFDHVPPPVAPPGTADEWFHEPGYPDSVPIGLGFRVPLILVSPWTRGGWVTSEVADHTSIIQFLEKWTAAIGRPAVSHNISSWRRNVCGDLTRAFDFTSPVYGLPALPPTNVVSAPLNGAFEPTPPYSTMPIQESGTKQARGLPYQPNANLGPIRMQENGSIQTQLWLSNNGPHVAKASHFAIYNNAATHPSYAHYPKHAPIQHTVSPVRGSATKSQSVQLNLGSVSHPGPYDITVIGPNRFLRRYIGNAISGDATAEVHVGYYPQGLQNPPLLELILLNGGLHSVTFTITEDYYTTGRTTVRVPAHGRVTHTVDPLSTSQGWYDVTITVSSDRQWSRRYVGHLETGQASVTGS